MTIKERYQKEEEKRLSPLATLSKNATRANEIDNCDIRGEFQRDRDRIIHSKAFRRLMHKTQVFISPQGDHYRTRLTHTFEVMQIARSIARAINLNEDLTEAIALGHDLGHTPFGHAGERALDEILKDDGGFKHYEQSVRIVNVLEKNRQGLNLTLEVCDGIRNHSGTNLAKTLEGRIVKFADKIAYISHDIDDSLNAAIITEQDIPIEIKEVLGFSFKERIDTMIRSVINNSIEESDITMDKSVFDAMYKLREYLFSNVYFNPKVNGQENKINALIKSLFSYYLKNQDKLPEEYQNYIESDGVKRAITDYIAGMTDRYAIEMYECLFVPKSFTISKNE